MIEIVLEILDGVILKKDATTVSFPADFGTSEGGAVTVTLKIISFVKLILTEQKLILYVSQKVI